MAHLQSELRVDPKLKDRMHDTPARDGVSGGVTSDTHIESFKASTPLERGKIAESETVNLFSAATNLASSIDKGESETENKVPNSKED